MIATIFVMYFLFIIAVLLHEFASILCNRLNDVADEWRKPDAIFVILIPIIIIFIIVIINDIVYKG